MKAFKIIIFIPVTLILLILTIIAIIAVTICIICESISKTLIKTIGKVADFYNSKEKYTKVANW